MRRRNGLIFVLSVTMIGSCMGLGACSQASQYRRHPTPELRTLAGSHANVKNRWAVVKNTNWRGFHDSMGRALYIDRPVRMQPAPVPY